MTATTNKEILASFKTIEGPEDAITVFLPDLKRFCKAVHANYIIFEVLGTDDNEQVARLHADEKRLALNLDRIATTERTQQGSDDTVAEVNRRASGILAPPSPDREAPGEDHQLLRRFGAGPLSSGRGSDHRRARCPPRRRTCRAS